MAERLAEGLYEHVVTGVLAVGLRALDKGSQSIVEPLDPADSHAVLARYLAAEVERTLAAVPQAKRPSAQIALVNGLLDHLTKAIAR